MGTRARKKPPVMQELPLIAMPGVVQVLASMDGLYLLDERGAVWRDCGGEDDAWRDRWQRLPSSGLSPGGRRCDVPRLRKLFMHERAGVLFALDAMGGCWRLDRTMKDEIEASVRWKRVAVSGIAMPG